jgi:hypothetical protein
MPESARRAVEVPGQPDDGHKNQNLFRRSDRGTAGRLRLSHSTEVAADLEWFSLRYPIDFRPAGVLEQAAAAHRETILQLEELLGDGYEPRDFGMALPPRTYQARQAEVCLAQGFLLSAIVFGELDWSPSVHEQAIGRLQRDGQTNKVVAKALAEAYLKKRGVRPERPAREPEPSALDQFAAAGG